MVWIYTHDFHSFSHPPRHSPTTSLPIGRGDRWIYRSAPLKPYRPLKISNFHGLSVMRQRYQASCNLKQGRGCRAQYDSNTWTRTTQPFCPARHVTCCCAFLCPASGPMRQPCPTGTSKDGSLMCRSSHNPFCLGSHCLYQKTRPLWSLGTENPRLTLSHRAIAGSGGIQSSNIGC